MDRVKPLKSLGQNFLVDENIVRKIIAEFKPERNDTVLEIGPGQGALTKHLFQLVDDITLIEFDKRTASQLSDEYEKADVVNTDFLKFDLNKEFAGKKIRVIGNIPYNITSPIIFKLIESRDIVTDAVLMVQHEVARRITAERGTKDYSLLTVLLDYFSEVRYCFQVSPNVFYPKPKVKSAVVHLRFDNKIDKDIENDVFIKVVKASFGNRRKTLKNSLSNSIFAKYDYSEFSGLLTKRAEELTTPDFIHIAKKIQAQQ